MLPIWGDKMKTYNILNCSINIDEGIALSDYWNDFRDSTKAEKDCLFQVEFDTSTSLIHGVQYIYSKIQGERFVVVDNSVMCINDSWDEAQLINAGTLSGRETLLSQLFYSNVVKQNILQVHSSLIEYEGKGILFVGPSGVGKTTQAELWNCYCNAKIINGDITFIQEIENKFYGWGTPWHGSSPYCLNTRVPIAVIVILKQEKENRIQCLRGFEKLTSISNNIFYPLWRMDAIDSCLQTLDRLIKNIPVYELGCRPDKESVTVLKDKL